MDGGFQASRATQGDVLACACIKEGTAGAKFTGPEGSRLPGLDQAVRGRLAARRPFVRNPPVGVLQ